ncbi:MAG: RtcB family protein, partial [Phycisphaerales bacterium]|nr:RtcB family protein [Phycisphaerales bacterium]
MKGRELVNLGMKQGPAVKAAMTACDRAYAAGWKRNEVRQAIKRVLGEPAEHVGDPIFGDVASALVNRPTPLQLREGLGYAVWGEEIEPQAHEQMRNACRLPVAVAAALMPDAHVGYGLPIGGVLATDNAVIPYAVGVDIACRVMLTVFDIPAARLESMSGTFADILQSHTRFGMGGEWEGKSGPWHEVMDDDWSVTPVTAPLKDKAWRQLGTSGSGNHFVEFGEVTFGANDLGVPPGVYLALLSHSGSRGPGAKVAKHYSDLAMAKHPGLPRELRHLAWLPMDEEGAEYWEAMELMGRFASANHHVIHDRIAGEVGGATLLQVENHHNFAWRETHDGREVIVHRKG